MASSKNHRRDLNDGSDKQDKEEKGCRKAGDGQDSPSQNEDVHHTAQENPKSQEHLKFEEQQFEEQQQELESKQRVKHEEKTDSTVDSDKDLSEVSDRVARSKVTIMDLARYKVGQRVFWIVFRTETEPEFDRADSWLKKTHPWFLWKHKIVPWLIRMEPPRMHPADTFCVLALCGQRPKIEPFRIRRVIRCPNSGEFLYKGPKGTVMPEGLLFPNRKRAEAEVSRIARLFATWTAGWNVNRRSLSGDGDHGVDV